MDYKDAKAVMEICEQIGHEDWPVCHGSFDCQWECGKKYNDPPCHKQVGECEHIKQIEPAGISEIFSVDCGEYLGLTNEMADYIAMAHKALPYWVQEAEQLREELKTLKNQHEGLKIAYRLACSNKNREDKNFELEG